jgi:hypothetical protein
LNKSYQKTPSPEFMNAQREQQIVNARLAALSAVAQVYQGTATSMREICEEADTVVKYVIGDVDALKPKSSLVLQTQMPPPGQFKPGD